MHFYRRTNAELFRIELSDIAEKKQFVIAHGVFTGRLLGNRESCFARRYPGGGVFQRTNPTDLAGQKNLVLGNDYGPFFLASRIFFISSSASWICFLALP